MLNHTKLAYALEQIASDLFVDNPLAHRVLQETWHQITQDSTFIYKVRAADSSWQLPTWSGALDTSTTIIPYHSPYTAISVDGSQIYPDRHMGISCYLINIGTVVIPYEVPTLCVALESDPYILSGYEEEHAASPSIDHINAQRYIYELQHGLQQAQLVRETTSSEFPLVLLFDGSLIFWHIDSSDIAKKYLQRYHTILEHLYQEKIICAWYISLPKARDLMSLIRSSLASFDLQQPELYDIVDQFTDATIAQLFLAPNTYSNVFTYHGPASEYYPQHLHPHFVYMRTEHEISRIEFSEWIAQDPTQVTTLMRMVLDQCNKGNGYPVVLAEAHEQAVVKGPDRELFYSMLEQKSLQYNRRPQQSRKLLKKKYVSM